MLKMIYKEQFKRKNLLILTGLFVAFFSLYVFLDFEGNENYSVMADEFGLFIVLVHVFINLIIGALTATMVSFSLINYSINKKDTIGSNAIPFLSFLFGLLTFGCTGCVIAFLASVGIAFTPVILPFGNLYWKLAALGFVALGFVWIMWSIEHTKCKVK
ncbi:MAG: hypothetical protein QM489_03480 [Candidatus Izemoplasma sp.]